VINRLRKWIPIALCCLPGVAGAVMLGVGVATGSTALWFLNGGPLGLAVMALALVACPVSMGYMMLRRRGSSHRQTRMEECCVPGPVEPAAEPGAPANGLEALRARREALERELAELSLPR
jgi:hypothetical protein